MTRNAMSRSAPLRRNAMADTRLALLAGPNAQNADWSKLSEAMTMTDAGTDRNDIWNKTGWWKKPDGQWKFEIDDSGAMLKGGTDKLGNAMLHSSAYEAYPTLAEIPITRTPDKNTTVASYSPFDNSLNINPAVVSRDLKKTLIHETQHAIDKIEDGIVAPQYRIGPFYQTGINEADARAVGKRVSLYPDERVTTPPWNSYDVPEERLTFDRRSTAQEALRQDEEALKEIDNWLDQEKFYRERYVDDTPDQSDRQKKLVKVEEAIDYWLHQAGRGRGVLEWFDEWNKQKVR